MRVDAQSQCRRGWRRSLNRAGTVRLVFVPLAILALVVVPLIVVTGQGGCAKAAPGPNDAGDRGPIVVSIAASATNAVQTLADRFTGETRVPVTINAGDSAKLAAQIVEGAPAVIFLSANRKWADLIDKKGLAIESTPLLGNRLVLIVPAGNPANVKGTADLTTDSVHHVALAGPAVPAGMYARQALEKLDLLSKLEAAGKIVDGDNVRVALAFVERGEAEAGIVYATDAKISSGVEVVATIDASLHDKIVYPLVLLKQAADDPRARQFFDYLQSPDGATVFEEFGFIWRPGE